MVPSPQLGGGGGGGRHFVVGTTQKYHFFLTSPLNQPKHYPSSKHEDFGECELWLSKILIVNTLAEECAKYKIQNYNTKAQLGDASRRIHEKCVLKHSSVMLYIFCIIREGEKPL